MQGLFRHALAALQRHPDRILEPQSFKAYTQVQSLAAGPTASHISVQNLAGLDADLRQADVMIFRLGEGADRTTRFALIQAERSVDEFFLSEIAPPQPPRTFVPEGAPSDLYPFTLLGDLTETGAVNLAIASGLLPAALGCDQPASRVSPATGASTYTFAVWPHRRLPDLQWTHTRGQVEVDAVYCANRDGAPVLFVIEAKHGPPAPLAKTKLAYACSAVATKSIPKDMSVVPIYLRAWQPTRGVTCFAITECSGWARPQSYVADLHALSTAHYAIDLR